MKPYLKSQQDLGGPLMDILGALLGGGASPAQSQGYPAQQSQPAPHSQPQQGTVLGTLDESGYQPSTSSSQPAPSQQGDGALGDILGSILGGGSSQQQMPSQQMPSQQSGGMGDILGSILGGAMGGGSSQQQMPSQQSGGMGDILGSILGGAMGGGSSQQQMPSQQSGGMGDILGSILGGAMGGGSAQPMPTQRSQQRNVPAPSSQSSAGMGDILGSILGGMLGGSSSGMSGRASQSSADPIGAILGSVLSGGMSSSGMGAANSGGMGGMLGGLLGAGAGAALLDLTPFGPIITDLANKLGIPPAIAKTVVSFALMKLITGAVQGRASAQKAPAMGLGADVSGLSARLGAGQGVDRRYLARSGMVDELVNQTGLDPRTATQSLLAAFNALGSQVPDEVQSQFQQQFAK